ncbi:Oxysterol-binding protein [Backusella circina FSU 941]|nr:Oxysterol-binding protein [Backusella circina FSU 941]
MTDQINNVDKIPSEQKGAFYSFLKSLASFTGDLSSVTCPAFLLAPESLIEYSEYWAAQPEIFTAIPQPEDPVERLLAFIKWFISYLNAAYKRRVPKGQWEKKPFNPVLGEQWLMDWVVDNDETNVVCEQVSHHPPITGFYIENKVAGVLLNGHSGQKTRISNATLVCDQTGREVLTLKSRDNETYLFTSPSLTVRGIWYAAPYVELIGTTYIQASTGYYASIEYSSRGWISGEKNHFKCLIRSNEDSLARKEYLYKVEGQWSGKSTVTDYKTKISKPFLDASTLTPATCQVKPLEQMGEMETRKIWKNVSDAIRLNDTVLAGKEKSIIENKKREEKKKRDEAGDVWHPEYFEWTEEDKDVKHLQNMLSKVIKQKHDVNANEYGNWTFKKSTSK